jgi:hypothetical protein
MHKRWLAPVRAVLYSQNRVAHHNCTLITTKPPVVCCGVVCYHVCLCVWPHHQDHAPPCHTMLHTCDAQVSCHTIHVPLCVLGSCRASSGRYRRRLLRCCCHVHLCGLLSARYVIQTTHVPLAGLLQDVMHALELAPHTLYSQGFVAHLNCTLKATTIAVACCVVLPTCASVFGFAPAGRDAGTGACPLRAVQPGICGTPTAH